MSGPGHFHSTGGGGGGSGPYSSSTTGFRSTTSRPAPQGHWNGHGVFTPAMRNRQARGKDPHQSGSDLDLEDDDSDADMQLRLLGLEDGDFAMRERRNQAAAYLDNPELLMMYALSTGDSIPAARLHFMEVMCGFDEDHPRGNAGSWDTGNGGGYRDPQRRRKASSALGGDGGGGSGSGASSDQGSGSGQKTKRRAGDRAAGR